MKEILERHNLHSKNLEKLDQPSLELQVSCFSVYISIFMVKAFEVQNVLLNDFDPDY